MAAPFVFGRRHRSRCAHERRIVALLYQDKAAFRAILLHELAHIRLGDVGKTYLALATGLAFALVSVVPSFAVMLFPAMGWRDRAALAVKITLWAVTIGLSVASILRAREFYADVQASVWEGTQTTLLRLLSASLKPGGTERPTLLRLHPKPAERRAAIADPSRLFPLSPWDAFAVGLAAWMSIDALRSLGLLLVLLTPDPRWFLVSQTLGVTVVPAIVLIFAIGAVGIGLWRSSFAALLLGGNPARQALPLGAAIGVGALIPPFITWIWHS